MQCCSHLCCGPADDHRMSPSMGFSVQSSEHGQADAHALSLAADERPKPFAHFTGSQQLRSKEEEEDSTTMAQHRRCALQAALALLACVALALGGAHGERACCQLRQCARACARGGGEPRRPTRHARARDRVPAAEGEHYLTNLPPAGTVSTAFVFPSYPDKSFPAGKMVSEACPGTPWPAAPHLRGPPRRRPAASCSCAAAGRCGAWFPQRRERDLQRHHDRGLAQLARRLQPLRAELHAHCEPPSDLPPGGGVGARAGPAIWRFPPQQHGGKRAGAQRRASEQRARQKWPSDAAGLRRAFPDAFSG